ncbi:MAG: hypothetical protein QW835_03955 [Candidatus Hadarchaeum sp.]|uniref:hypothetical protein n=1 Tax=Candidatus Hadarchaeum sp. TaxID=2883567 RepID=UPI00317EF8AD
MGWDEELKQIREKKLKKLMGRAGKGGQKAMPGKPMELNATSFRELIRAHPIVVVDCWAS